jgi:hypothetical protein
MNKLPTMLFQVVTVEECCNNMLTILFIVGRTTLFTPVDINLEQVVDFLNFYVCKIIHQTQHSSSTHAVKCKNLSVHLICLITTLTLENLYVHELASCSYSSTTGLCSSVGQLQDCRFNSCQRNFRNCSWLGLKLCVYIYAHLHYSPNPVYDQRLHTALHFQAQGLSYPT